MHQLVDTLAKYKIQFNVDINIASYLDSYIYLQHICTGYLNNTVPVYSYLYNFSSYVVS